MKIPFISTAIVATAVATMIGLGIWQLHRAEWKKGLIAQYEANSTLPPVSWPAVPPDNQSLLYRRATGFCLQPVSWRAVAGRNRKDEPGWAHIAACRTGAEGPGMQVDVGWSKASGNPAWRGGAVSGLIVPDRKHVIRLVAEDAAPGLEPSKLPSRADTPNNHMLYALQWFFFALAAAIIYGLALRKRQRNAGDPPPPPAAAQ
ncbi:MAG TPA: SURF1 family protein [Allosphingosinicella sp.]|nr:SURF1 family protein [Allosphingosinicella sp.]